MKNIRTVNFGFNFLRENSVFEFETEKENSETIISSFILWHWMRGIIVMLWFNLCVMVLFFMRSMVVISALRGQQKHKIGCSKVYKAMGWAY